MGGNMGEVGKDVSVVDRMTCGRKNYFFRDRVKFNIEILLATLANSD